MLKQSVRNVKGEIRVSAPGRGRKAKRTTETPAGSTRERVLAAARELAIREGLRGFTMEKLAEEAGVSRMTLYYQFGSRDDLLEALFDWVATRGRLSERLPEAFRRSDPRDALEDFIRAFCGFWASDREGIRRLRGWSMLESDPGHGRDAWRLEGLNTLIVRLASADLIVTDLSADESSQVLGVLTSFETYDSMARSGLGEEEIGALLIRASRLVLGTRR